MLGADALSSALEVARLGGELDALALARGAALVGVALACVLLRRPLLALAQAALALWVYSDLAPVVGDIAAHGFKHLTMWLRPLPLAALAFFPLAFFGWRALARSPAPRDKGVSMPPAASHRRFLLVDQSLVPFAFNFVLNGAIAYALFRSAEFVPFIGQSSIVGDTVITSFVLPFATCLIVTGLIHKQVAAGKVLALSQAPRGGLGGFLGARGKALRGVLLGLAAIALFAAPALLAFSAAGIEQLPRDSFLWFKAGYAGALAAIVQPAIAWLALAPRAA